MDQEDQNLLFQVIRARKAIYKPLKIEVASKLAKNFSASRILRQASYNKFVASKIFLRSLVSID